jgi:hydrogenase maturation protease
MTRSSAVDGDAGRPAWLVLGYGNTLRCDDALGVLAAEAVAQWGLPGVRVLTTFQLLPELAEEIAAAARVVFVDARVDDRAAGVIARRLELSDGDAAGGLGWTHMASPSVLVHLAEHVYGHRPEAWVVSIPAFDLGYGEGLSDAGAAALAEAIERIAALLRA